MILVSPITEWNDLWLDGNGKDCRIGHPINWMIKPMIFQNFWKKKKPNPAKPLRIMIPYLLTIDFEKLSSSPLAFLCRRWKVAFLSFDKALVSLGNRRINQSSLGPCYSIHQITFTQLTETDSSFSSFFFFYINFSLCPLQHLCCSHYCALFAASIDRLISLLKLDQIIDRRNLTSWKTWKSQLFWFWSVAAPPIRDPIPSFSLTRQMLASLVIFRE